MIKHQIVNFLLSFSQYNRTCKSVSLMISRANGPRHLSGFAGFLMGFISCRVDKNSAAGRIYPPAVVNDRALVDMYSLSLTLLSTLQGNDSTTSPEER